METILISSSETTAFALGLFTFFFGREAIKLHKEGKLFKTLLTSVFCLIPAITAACIIYYCIVQSSFKMLTAVSFGGLFLIILLFWISCFYVKGCVSKIGMFLLSGVTAFLMFSILFSMSFSNSLPLSQKEVKINSSEELQNIMQVKSLPALHLQSAESKYYSEKCVFALDNEADSIALKKVAADLQKKYPMQCKQDGEDFMFGRRISEKSIATFIIGKNDIIVDYFENFQPGYTEMFEEAFGEKLPPHTIFRAEACGLEDLVCHAEIKFSKPLTKRWLNRHKDSVQFGTKEGETTVSYNNSDKEQNMTITIQPDKTTATIEWVYY